MVSSSLDAESGAVADVGDGVPLAPALQVARAREIDAARRQHFGGGSQVQGGHGLARTHAAAAHHVAFQGIGPLEEARRQRHPAALDQLAHSAAADDAAPAGGHRHDLGFESQFPAQFGQQLDVAGVAVAEAEIVAHQHGPRAQPRPPGCGARTPPAKGAPPPA